MTTKIILSALCASLLTVHTTFAQQQEAIANKPNVTYTEIIDHIEKLIGTGNDSTMNLLRLEAIALSKSDTEDFRVLAAMMYEDLFKDTDQAQEIKREIEQKFPKGKFARAKAFASMLEDLSATEMEKKYQTILQEFPKENFKGDDLDIYDHAILELSAKYASDGNVDKATEYIKTLEEGKYFVIGVVNVHESLPESDRSASPLSPLIEKAYNKSIAATASKDEEVSESYDAMFLDPISALYANTLLQSGKLDEALQISKQQLKKATQQRTLISLHLKTAVAVLEQQNKKNEVLGLLEEHIEYLIIKENRGEGVPELVNTYKRLYTDVHGADADLYAALDKIDEKVQEAIQNQYRQEMIKEEAPGFTLLNREGKAVSLSDYKGKVVVLDFWATWCMPCIVSFPGMQAAVNKYESDPEVEFLFINTWQREDNYKEVVEGFLTEIDYNFHVLFDEMKDRSQAVVNAYNIRGIPTKIVIDKEGFIRFRSSGGEEDVDKIVSELDAKIELAKKEEM